jgi:hypothetical protein
MQTEFTHHATGPSSHAYNDPDLSPIEFLYAVYRDASLPMSIRIEAARGLLPYTEPRPARIPSSDVSCTIVIPPFDYEPRTNYARSTHRNSIKGARAMAEFIRLQRSGQVPRTLMKEFVAKDPGPINTILQSFRVRRPETRQPSSKKRDAVYTETTSHPPFFTPFQLHPSYPAKPLACPYSVATKAQGATYKTSETLSSVPLIGRFGHENGMWCTARAMRAMNDRL